MPAPRGKKKKSSVAKSRRRMSVESTISTISQTSTVNSEPKTPENRITRLPPQVPKSTSKRNGDWLSEMRHDSFQAQGFLYSERLNSFFIAKWPYMNTKDTCHPHNLAMAGFTFASMEPSPSAECIVCFVKIEDLARNSDPWVLHCEANPECALVQLGYPDCPDSYTMRQMLDLCGKAWANKFEKLATYGENYMMEFLTRIAANEQLAINKEDDEDSWSSANEL